jgi:hypothetical protein
MRYQQQISVTTKESGDMHDLTEQVASVATSSGIQTGIVNIFDVGIGSRGRAFSLWLSVGYLHHKCSIPFPTLASPPPICDKNRMR